MAFAASALAFALLEDTDGMHRLAFAALAWAAVIGFFGLLVLNPKAYSAALAVCVLREEEVEI